MRREGDAWCVVTRRGVIKAGCIVNCGGNYGDEVESLGDQAPVFSVVPGKGEYIVFPCTVSGTVARPVVPVPTKQTAGLYVFETVYGHTVVGPTNVRQPSKTDRTVSVASMTSLMSHIVNLYPKHPQGHTTGVLCRSQACHSTSRLLQ